MLGDSSHRQLELDRISKSYGSVEVLKPLSLVIENGEFLTILGPSGSGKTTILRLIGGFIEPTGGAVRFDGRDITRLPTHKRPFNTVFQDYALFPHMTVAKNVAYGLMLRKTPSDVTRKTVVETLEIVGLSGLLDRYPSQLSGGQRQRVAIARALVCEPQLILLDEPLSALDAELRRQMQFFLKDLQRRVRTTFVFVTHDQEEATTMSDRIVVMDQGRIEQVGSPQDIYYHPRTPFVAGFFGDNNLLDGRVVEERVVDTPFGRVCPPGVVGLGRGTKVKIAIRPERLILGATDAKDTNTVPVEVIDVVFVGAITQAKLRLNTAPDCQIMAKLTSGQLELRPGQRMEIAIRSSDLAIVK